MIEAEYTVPVPLALLAPLLVVAGAVLIWRQVGLVRDIAERSRLAAELETQREQLAQLVEQRTQALQVALQEGAEADNFSRLIADHMPARIAYLDSERRCRFVNRGYCDWLGKPADQLLGRGAAEIFGPEADEVGQTRVDAALAGTAQRFERDEVGASGQVQTTLLQFVPDRRDSRVRGIFVLALDISESRQAKQSLERLNEELMQALRRAEAGGRAKGAFLANMSHEIRTPMNAIIGLTHLLRRDNPEGATAERLSRVSDAARHLLELVNDILDLSKIESGKLMLEEAEFALDALLLRVCGLVTEAARDKGLELVIDTDHAPGLLRGDAARLSQALTNLLGNAVKFTESGSVTVVTSLVSAEGDDVMLRFEVRDTGPGIPPAQLGRLFNSFEQADGSITRRYGGSGLGLAITRHLAQLMGGDAGASSEPGSGSRFWFTARLKVVELAFDREREPLLAGLRGLLVDDLADARVALGQMLRRLGLRTDTAASGGEALALAQAARAAGDPYDIALLDWVMPGINGIETARLLLEQSAEQPPACIIVSIANDDRMRQAALEIGITNLLQKPVSFATLRGRLMHLLIDRAPDSRPAGLDLISEQALRSQHEGAKVLLAEDNPVNQEVATSLLKLAGLRVDVATTGSQAVALASVTDYALILMDMQMPELDGIRATKLLRARAATASTPIIAMTANAYLEDREECLAAGMNDFLTKPVDPPVLYDMLTRWLQPGAVEPAVAAAPPPATGIAAGSLALVPGLDEARGQAVFAGDPAFYRAGLRRFAELYDKGDRAIDEPLAAYIEHRTPLPREALRRALHSFGGASASVGATQLAQVSARLGERLGTRGDADADAADDDADDESIVAGLLGLRDGLRKLVNGLREALRLA